VLFEIENFYSVELTPSLPGYVTLSLPIPTDGNHLIECSNACVKNFEENKDQFWYFFLLFHVA